MTLDVGMGDYDLRAVPEYARKVEAIGYDCLWTSETQHDPFLPLAVAAALIAWRGRPQTEGDLALQAAILNVVAFILAKQMFFNYYFASEVMLLAAMAGAGVALPEADVTRPAVVTALARDARRLLGNRRAPRRTPTATPTAARLTPPPTRKASWVPPTELSHPARRPPIGAGTPVKMYP